MHLYIRAVAYVIALAWVIKVLEAARGLPRVSDLLLPQHDLTPTNRVTLTVIVPACNEAGAILPCLQSLLQQDYPVQIIAVDDRSTDATGRIMDTVFAAHPGRLTVIHITELPEGWLGKTHALALAARQAAVLTQPDFLLFTDADVVFKPDALRCALAHAEATRADHLVVMPTPLLHRWDEALLLGAFQIFGMWALRPWRVEDPNAMHDVVGVGAFNLMRRSAYEQLGGFELQRLDIVEDLTLARRVKQAGLRQRIAFARGLIEVHWASGVQGILGVMTKNLFAIFGFRLTLVFTACIWLLSFCVFPAAAVFYAPARIPGIIFLLSLIWAYRLYGKQSGISSWYAAGFPLGAILFIVGLLRSTVVTLVNGGVRWRGTFYPLSRLRKNASPLVTWRR